MTIIFTVLILVGAAFDILSNGFSDRTLMTLSLAVFVWIVAIKVCCPTLLFKELKIPAYLKNKRSGINV